MHSSTSSSASAVNTQALGSQRVAGLTKRKRPRPRRLESILLTSLEPGSAAMRGIAGRETVCRRCRLERQGYCVEQLKLEAELKSPLPL
jgi:hypothetical protein